MSNSIAISSFQDNSVEDAEVVSIKTEEIKETKQDEKTKQTIVVYNQYSMESVLSAALIKQRYPKAEVYEASLQIPETGDQYLWLGVSPNPGIFSSKDTWSVDHIVSIQGYPIRQFSLKMGHPVYKLLSTQGGEYHANSVGRLMEYLGIHIEKYQGLVDLVHKFYDKGMDIDTLAYIYAGVRSAEESLVTGTFTLEPPSLSQVESYMVAVKFAKSELKDNYALKGVTIKGVNKTAFITCNVKDFWLVRRLSGFVYDTYVNTSMMLRGPSVHSNVDVSQIVDFSNITTMA